jgi:hypothetical protein
MVGMVTLFLRTVFLRMVTVLDQRSAGSLPSELTDDLTEPTLKQTFPLFTDNALLRPVAVQMAVQDQLHQPLQVHG